MQDQATAVPEWLLPVLRNLASFGAGALFLKFIALWQNRKKPFVEVKKTEAETTEITIRSHATAGDSLTRMMDRLDKAAVINDNLRATNADLKEKCDKLEMEVESYDRQMKRMKAYMDFKGLKYSEMDGAE